MAIFFVIKKFHEKGGDDDIDDTLEILMQAHGWILSHGTEWGQIANVLMLSIGDQFYTD